jgi:hypothetical protein
MYPASMEPEGSLSYLQDSDTVPYPKSHDSSPNYPTPWDTLIPV